MSVFSAGEIVEMAIVAEEVGTAFYEALAEQRGDENLKAIFVKLADDELQHKLHFSKLLETVRDYKLPAESYPGEWDAYVRALVESQLLISPEEARRKAKQVKELSDALNIGITLEKDSILFYDAMKRFVHESEHNTLNAIIGQERRHLEILLELKKQSK